MANGDGTIDTGELRKWVDDNVTPQGYSFTVIDVRSRQEIWGSGLISHSASYNVPLDEVQEAFTEKKENENGIEDENDMEPMSDEEFELEYGFCRPGTHSTLIQ